MEIVIVGGGELDESRLAQLVEGAGLGCRVRSAPGPAAQGVPCALVFEAPEQAELAAATLRLVRENQGFAALSAIASISPADLHRPDSLQGFDDFLISPYAPDDLHSLLWALERRKGKAGASGELAAGRLLVDTGTHQVSVDGRAIRMTHREFTLLAHLWEQRGRILSREELLARVWGVGYRGSQRTIDIHVCRLRAKLGDAFPLETLRGRGYRLSEEPRVAAGAPWRGDGAPSLVARPLPP